MSHSIPLSMNPSPEFIALCQAQISLLSQELQAAWSIVYLTKGWVNSRETKFTPVVAYPSREFIAHQSEYIQELPKIWLKNLFPVALPEAETTGDILAIKPQETLAIWKPDSEQERLIILPLVYEQKMMGLLVTQRNERKWKKQELVQIEKIAKTLAIACFLDQRKEWYEGQLKEQHYQQELERDRIDNLLHQLRNPLTALKTFGKLLLKRFLPEDSNQPIIKGILRESDRLQELLQEFEAEIQQRIEETPTIELIADRRNNSSVGFLLPSSSLTLESISIDEILEPLMISAQAIAQERKIILSSNLPSSLPLVQANSRALREVFSNLIDNALKYTPEGGKVDIATQLKFDDLDISISDTGYGIPVGDREHLFERHYRGVQAEGDIPGTGLGLAIAKELIEQMDGTIEIISPNPTSNNPELPGTIFTVSLPLAEEA